MNITKPEQEMITALRNKGYDVEIQNLTDLSLPHDWSYLKVQGEIMALQEQVKDLNSRTSLLSKSFFTRAFSVLGLYLFAIAIVGIGVALVIVVIGAAGG